MLNALLEQLFQVRVPCGRVPILAISSVFLHDHGDVIMTVQRKSLLFSIAHVQSKQICGTYFCADRISIWFHYLHTMKVYVECDIFKLYIGFLVM